MWKNFVPTAWLLGAVVHLLSARDSYPNGEIEEMGVKLVMDILFFIHAVRGYAMMLVRRNARK